MRYHSIEQITSREVEDTLASRFNISAEQRERMMDGRSTSKWANYVHFVLVALQREKNGRKYVRRKRIAGDKFLFYRRAEEKRSRQNALVEEESNQNSRSEQGRTYDDLDRIIADGCFIDRELLSSILEIWHRKKNLVLQGPPGTGKTWLAKRLAMALIGSPDDDVNTSSFRAVQFHPTLSYEDFVRGWRPGGDGRLVLSDGILMQAIDSAASEPERPFVLVIEEINRGNPAQIFGEMLTLLENTKRRASEAIELAYRKAPGERVYVPDNLYLIGTMNVADRSLALVDLALRRRFAFVDLEPQLNGAWRQWCRKHGLDDSTCSEIESRITGLNAEISSAVSLGPQFRIGHSYVTPDVDEAVADGRAWFRAKVETEIGPLLEEYWYDTPEKARDAKKRLLAGFA